MRGEDMRLIDILDLLVTRLNEAREDIAKLKKASQAERWETKTAEPGVHEEGWEPVGGSAYSGKSQDDSEWIAPLVVLRRRIP